jgi:adenylate cyclase
MPATEQHTFDEKKRLQALRSLDLLDTEPEERFQRICRIAKEILDVPVAYIALLDDKRQWFKAQCGLGDIKETGREGTFCDMTIRQAGSVMVLNAAEDPYWRDKPYVIGPPNTRFYLGFPLRVNGDQAVGTLCVLDFAARTSVCPEKLGLMGDLARISETELTLRDSLQMQALLLTREEELCRKNDFIRRVLGRYVTDEVADHVLSAPEELHIGGERREVTILMSDLRGFTVMSDKIGPEKVVQILNHYLHHMVEIALKWGGTVDEIIGDALLIIFGAPLKSNDHARRAACCAIEMQQAMDSLNDLLRQEELTPIACGIGLNTGEVVVGNIGSEKRMKYSVVGSPVNLTARIEAFTIGGQILASKETCQQIGDARIDGRLRVNMKGYSKPVSIYEIGGVGELQLPPLED